MFQRNDWKAPSRAGALRKLILGTFLLALLGTAAELLLLEHTEEFWQYIPLVLMAAGFLLLIAAAVYPRKKLLRFFQLTMVLFVVSGFAGLWLHYQANIEFELELYPSLGGWELFWKAIQGKSPPSLAPGMMFELGLLGWAYTFCHPVLRATSTEVGEERKR